jgi:hypothetical protein
MACYACTWTERHFYRRKTLKVSRETQFAFLKHGTEYCKVEAVIGRCASVDVVRSTARSTEYSAVACVIRSYAAMQLWVDF